MQFRSDEPNIVYRIIERATGKEVPCYFRGSGDEYDFASADSARESNCHGIFKDGDKYAIAKYRVTYDLLDPDCDPGWIAEPMNILERVMSTAVNDAFGLPAPPDSQKSLRFERRRTKPE